MHFDRFDIVEAHYAFCSDYHEGQGSKKYQRLCRISDPNGRIQLRVSPLWGGYSSLSENGKEIYLQLVDRFEKDLLG